MRRLLNVVLVIAVFGIASSIAQEKKSAKAEKNAPHEKKPLVTFVELGSVKCIPCRQMQPVMKAIEKKYGNQVNVVFYDVWQSEQRSYAEQYGIRLIPTQVFLDKEGKEFSRHEGFYPEGEIHKLLQKRGLRILTGE